MRVLVTSSAPGVQSPSLSQATQHGDVALSRAGCLARMKFVHRLVHACERN